MCAKLIVEGVGRKSEEKYFVETYKSFFDSLEELVGVANNIYGQEPILNDHADKAIYFLGRCCLEDFNEILLLATHGYGIGALKILRGMYERAVDCAYLNKKPSEATAYLHYSWVNRKKSIDHLRREDSSFMPDEAQIKEIMQGYEEAQNYLYSKDNWCKHGLMERAKIVELGKLYMMASFIPTMQIHSNPLAFETRMTAIGEDVSFDMGARRQEAKHAISQAHLLLITILDHVQDHFKMGFEEDIKAINKTFMSVWLKQSV